MKPTRPFDRRQLMDTRDYVNALVLAIGNYPLSREGVAAAAVDAVLADLRARAGFREVFASCTETEMQAIRSHQIGVVSDTISHVTPVIPVRENKTAPCDTEEISFS